MKSTNNNKEATTCTLPELQNWMQGMLTNRAAIPGESEVSAIVKSSARLDASRHLDIYRQSYIARLRECMKNQFSALAFALGEDLFRMFTDEYLHSYPSQSYTLNDLGERFPAFLAATRPDADAAEKEDWPDFMIELASFEFDLSLLFDAHITDDAVAADAETPEEQLVVSPTIRLFHHRFPICRYYLDFSNGAEPELPWQEESYCIANRKDYRLGLLSLQPAQFHLLSMMQQGETVASARARLVKEMRYDAVLLEQYWPEWKKHFIASSFFRVKY